MTCRTQLYTVLLRRMATFCGQDADRTRYSTLDFDCMLSRLFAISATDERQPETRISGYSPRAKDDGSGALLKNRFLDLTNFNSL